jgi:hypothetical protein
MDECGCADVFIVHFNFFSSFFFISFHFNNEPEERVNRVLFPTASLDGSGDEDVSFVVLVFVLVVVIVEVAGCTSVLINSVGPSLLRILHSVNEQKTKTRS